jgi:hypothetical protein
MPNNVWAKDGVILKQVVRIVTIVLWRVLWCSLVLLEPGKLSGYRMNARDSIPSRDTHFSVCHLVWDPSSASWPVGFQSLINGYSRSVNLTSYVMSRWWIKGALSPFPCTSSVFYLSTDTNLPLYFPYFKSRVGEISTDGHPNIYILIITKSEGEGARQHDLIATQTRPLPAHAVYHPCWRRVMRGRCTALFMTMIVSYRAGPHCSHTGVSKSIP